VPETSIDCAEVGRGEDVERAAGGRRAAVRRAGGLDAAVGRVLALDRELRVLRTGLGAAGRRRDARLEQVRVVRAARDRVLDVRVAHVSGRRSRRYGRVPAQERPDPAVQRAAELPGRDADVLDELERAVGRGGELVDAVGVRDRVARAGLQALADEADPPEDHLVAVDRLLVGEGGLEAERRVDAAAAGRRNVRARQEVEDLARPVVRERDRPGVVRHIARQEPAERLVRVEAELELLAGVVLVPDGEPSVSLIGPTAVRWPAFFVPMISPAATPTVARKARATTMSAARWARGTRGRDRAPGARTS
jgi:hypothetical protein